jgi:aminoglycoside 6'-N-acetyltransferase I
MTDQNEIRVDICAPADLNDWVQLRRALWTHDSEDELLVQAKDLIARRAGAVTFLARADRSAIGFAEATLRRDYVNGCATSPVAFLEGLYVSPTWRRRGAARLLCKAVENWARDLGCLEIASDTYLDYVESQRMHEALGFEEMERVVCYRKAIQAVERDPSGGTTVL